MNYITRRSRYISTTALLVAAIGAPQIANASDLPRDYGGFVSAEGTKLKLNGGDFYFSGANTYAMLYSRDEAEEIMRVAQSLGLNAIRFWGFWDGEEYLLDDQGNQTDIIRGTDRWGRPVLRPRPGVYNEQSFRNFDYAIYLAHVYGIKLVIPLLNEWDEFGGLKKYLEWDGYEWPKFNYDCGYQENMTCYAEIENIVKAERWRFFQACSTCKKNYFDHVHQVLNRVNTITGVAYKDDPAIMIWEVMNEPRIGPWRHDATATVIRDFVREAADFIKSIDSNHLVSTGEEGFFFEGEAEHYTRLEEGNGQGGEGGQISSGPNKTGYGWDTAPGEGSSFVLDLEVPSVDIGTYHAWPFNWNKAHEQNGVQYAGRIDQFMVEWVESHAAAAKAIGKPLFLGEFGWQILRTEGSDLADRDKILRATYDAVLRTETSGMMYWNITASHNPTEAIWTGPFIDRRNLDAASWDDEPTPHDMDFRFDIYCPEDISTCEIIREATRAITARITNPDPPFTSLCFEPRVVCDDTCVELGSHPEHCGACNNACSEGEMCSAGACKRRPQPVWAKPSSKYDTTSCSALGPTGKGTQKAAWPTLALLLLAGGVSRRFSRRRLGSGL